MLRLTLLALAFGLLHRVRIRRFTGHRPLLAGRHFTGRRAFARLIRTWLRLFSLLPLSLLPLPLLGWTGRRILSLLTLAARHRRIGFWRALALLVDSPDAVRILSASRSLWRCSIGIRSGTLLRGPGLPAVLLTLLTVPLPFA